jgi:hypothetical protein
MIAGIITLLLPTPANPRTQREFSIKVFDFIPSILGSSKNATD